MKKLIFTIVVITAILFSCKKEQEKENPRLDYKFAVNEEFEIELKSNPTTGYSWFWTNKEDVENIDSIGHSYISDTPILTGSGGTEIWKFKGNVSGTDTIVFKYLRPWEPNNVVEVKSFVVEIE